MSSNPWVIFSSVGSRRRNRKNFTLQKSAALVNLVKCRRYGRVRVFLCFLPTGKCEYKSKRRTGLVAVYIFMTSKMQKSVTKTN